MPEITDEFEFDEPDEKFSHPRDPRNSQRQRRLNLIPFDWRKLPRVDWPHGNQSVHSFEAWPIPQPDGRKLTVETVHQAYIYAGALLGGLMAPSDYIVQAIASAEALYPNERSAPVILPPTLYAGTRAWVSQGVPEREDWVSLPRVRCVAGLFSTKPARDQTEVFSSAVVIWFQDHFGLPDERVQSQLVNLNWSEIASDWCP